VTTFREDATHNSPTAAIKRFAIEVFLAAYGSVIASFLLAMPLLLIFGTRSSPSLDRWFDAPYFAVPAVIAAAGAYFFYRRTRRQPNIWVWVLPTIILIWNLFTWDRYSGQIYWKDVWDNFFGFDCGSSECLYELTVTGPCYCAVAYSLVAIILRVKNSPPKPLTAHPSISSTIPPPKN
jgi:hypothetical protein